MMRHPRAKWFLTSAAAAILVLAALLPMVAAGANPYEQLLQQMARKSPGDEEIVAVVDGVSVTRREIRQLVLGAKAEQPGIKDEDARQRALRLGARNAAAVAEAKRRGIQVAREEAQQFTDHQRELYRQSPESLKATIIEDMKAKGLSEEEYWRQMVDAYSEVIAVGKLRVQVQSEVPPTAPGPRLALVDVSELFPSPEPLDPLPFQVGLVRVVVVGFRDDSDALMAAAAEGIPFYLIEKLTAAELEWTVGDSRRVSDLYARMGQLCAERVHQYLLRCYAGSALTEREAQVLGLVAEGYTNPRISRVLRIQLKTVKNHMTHIYEKLGVRGRHEAIARAAAIRIRGIRPPRDVS